MPDETYVHIELRHRFVNANTELRSPESFYQPVSDGTYPFRWMENITTLEGREYRPSWWTYKYEETPTTFFRSIDRNSNDSDCLTVSLKKGTVTATCWYLDVTPCPTCPPGRPQVVVFGFMETTGLTRSDVIDSVVPAEAWDAATHPNGVYVEEKSVAIIPKQTVENVSFYQWSEYNPGWESAGIALLADQYESGYAMAFYGNVQEGDNQGDSPVEEPDDHHAKWEWQLFGPIESLITEIERMEKLNTIMHHLIEKGLWPPHAPGHPKNAEGGEKMVSQTVDRFVRKGDQAVSRLRDVIAEFEGNVGRAKSDATEVDK